MVNTGRFKKIVYHRFLISSIIRYHSVPHTKRFLIFSYNFDNVLRFRRILPKHPINIFILATILWRTAYKRKRKLPFSRQNNLSRNFLINRAGKLLSIHSHIDILICVYKCEYFLSILRLTWCTKVGEPKRICLLIFS